MGEFLPSRRTFLAGMGAAPIVAALAQDNDWLRRVWSAHWIRVPGTSATEFGIYHFRRAFDLATRPERFVVHASADNRYQLFANGRRVASGPARGDLFHWRYETVDLAPYLEAGRNVLAAVVWNFGEMAPEAQVTFETGFLLDGDGAAERVADSGPEWKCARNAAYAPSEVSYGSVRGYFVVGPAERVEAAAYPWGWETPGFDDAAWKQAEVIGPAAGREAQDVHSRWMLVPRNIPLEEERPERLQTLRLVSGVARPARFPAAREAVSIPAGTKATLLLDQGYLTTAYPELVVSGGRGATVRIGYAESMFEPQRPGTRGLEKGNRNEVEGKRFIGYSDEFLPDGGAGRAFRPLWWRTYRYMQLEIETRGEALTHRRSARHLRGLSVRPPRALRIGFARDRPHAGRGLAHGAAVRARNLHGLPVLRAAPICGRYARAVPDFAVQQRRRAADAQRHRADRRFAGERRRHHEPLSHAPGAVHPRLLAVVDRDGARLLVVRGRAGVRAPHAARRARGAELFRGLPEGERVAQDAAVVALFRLGAGMAERQRAAGCRWRRGAVRYAAGHGVRLGRGPGSRAGPAGAGGVVHGPAEAVAADRAAALLGCGPRIVRRHANRRRVFPSMRKPWRCWRT